MNVIIQPGPLRGSVPAIPSKSHLHRLLICAALADRETILTRAETRAEDILATRRCLGALGASIRETEAGLSVIPIDRTALPARALLDCGESGSTLRFLLPLAAALGVEAEFLLAGRLPLRPMEDLEAALRSHGCVIERSEDGSLHLSGHLTPGDYELPGGVSSQYITGLLLALPLLAGESRLRISGTLESEDYVTLTLETQRAFGCDIRQIGADFLIPGGAHPFLSPGRIDADGDWSNAAFWLSLGAMPGGHILCSGLNRQSRQGDRAVLDVLTRMGAAISWQDGGVLVHEGARVATEINASHIPDLIPPLAAVAAVSRGSTRMTNAGRLRLKESDRLKSVSQTLRILGADLQEEAEGLIIRGVPHLSGGTVESHGDHRIAMMVAVAAAACKGPVTILGAQAVDKSYPDFWKKLAALGQKVEVIV